MSPDRLDLTTVKETPMDCTIQSVTMDEFSCSTIIQTTTEFHDQQLSHSPSAPTPGHTPKCISSLVTPTKEVTANPNNQIPKMESSLNLSVNSHTQKRFKFMGSPLVSNLKRGLDTPDHFMSDSTAISDASCRVECVSEINCSNNNLKRFHVPQDGHAMEKTLQISCLLCKTPLGLPENNFTIPCSLTSLSKIHLASLWKGKLETPAMNPPSVPIVVTDISSVDQRVCSRTTEGAAGQGIWSKEDGCVFNTIVCPFCSEHSNCLGLHVMATDTSNIQLLNKVLLYLDRLEIKDLEEFKHKGSSPCSGSYGSESPVFISIEEFAYSPQSQNSGGWRTTRSKMRLPKKG